MKKNVIFFSGVFVVLFSLSLYLLWSNNLFNSIPLPWGKPTQESVNRMKLTTKNWEWQQMMYPDGRIEVPKKIDTGGLILDDNGKFRGGDGCNGIWGEYNVSGSSIMFKHIIATEAVCLGKSSEMNFVWLLSKVQSYHFNTENELVFNLISGGMMVFR